MQLAHLQIVYTESTFLLQNSEFWGVFYVKNSCHDAGVCPSQKILAKWARRHLGTSFTQYMARLSNLRLWWLHFFLISKKMKGTKGISRSMSFFCTLFSLMHERDITSRLMAGHNCLLLQVCADQVNDKIQTFTTCHLLFDLFYFFFVECPAFCTGQIFVHQSGRIMN